MFVGRGIGVIRARFAGQVASGRIVRVTLDVDAIRPAADIGTNQAIQRIVGEGLRLRAREGIHDGFDVAYRIVIIGQVLERIARGNLRGSNVPQPSAIHAPGTVGIVGFNLVRAANHLDHAIGGIVGDGLAYVSVPGNLSY